MEKVTIKSNFDLEGRLWLPKEAKSGIVIAHSLRNNMDEPACLEAEKLFADNGYAVLTFNFLGHGNSGGRLRNLSYRTVGENISSAIEHLRNLGIKNIGVYAISIGAIASVHSSEKPLRQVFLSPTPLYSPSGLLERYSDSIDQRQLDEKGYCLAMSGSGRGSFEMGKEWIEEMRTENGKVLNRHIQRRVPTLIIQGTEDPSFNKDKIGSFTSASGDSYYEISGADHNFTNLEHRKAAIQRALEWFNESQD